MRHRTCCTLALFLATATAFGQQPTDLARPLPQRQQGRESDSTFIIREWAAWNALKVADSAAFVRVLGYSPSLLLVGTGVNRTSAAQFAGMVTKCDTRSSKLDMFTVARPTDDTAILVYRVTLDRRCGRAVGRKSDVFAGQFRAMTVWVRRGGRWEAVAQSLLSLGTDSDAK